MFCQWTLNPGFQSLVRFQIPWAVFRIGLWAQDFGSHKHKFPEFHKQKFFGCRNPHSLTWSDTRNTYSFVLSFVTALLDMESMGTSVVRLKGVVSNSYFCMNGKGIPHVMVSYINCWLCNVLPRIAQVKTLIKWQEICIGQNFRLLTCRHALHRWNSRGR